MGFPTTDAGEKTAIPASTVRNEESAQRAPDSSRDVALTVVDANRSTPIDPAVEARVLWKIDLFLMPVMLIGYGLVYYDKVRSSVRFVVLGFLYCLEDCLLSTENLCNWVLEALSLVWSY